MTEQVLTLVRIPLAEIEEWIRTKHDLPSVLSDFRLEDNTLVLYFRDEEEQERKVNSELPSDLTRRRRARRKRNRMKTRGWEVVARITNSKGQCCAIYRPFVEALQDPKLTIEEQKKAVERILRSNRNRPFETSIQYFLENTIEYLQKQREQTPQDKVA